MAHTAGVRNDGGDEGPLFWSGASARLRGEAHRGVSAAVRAGHKYRYSSYGWILVSAAVEAAAGSGSSTFMRREIFEPLGMADTLPTRRPNRFREGDLLLSAVLGDPRYGPDVMREIDLRATPAPASSCPRRPTWCVSGWRSTAAAVFARLRRPRVPATRHRSTAPDVTEAAVGRGDRLRPRLGPRDRHGGGSTNARRRSRR